MIRLLTLSVLLFAGATLASQRISGGSPTDVENVPWIAQVDFHLHYTGSWYQLCAASILNSRFVLSSAQCFSGYFYAPEYRRIRAGATYRNAGGVLVNVERAYTHPSFDLYQAGEARTPDGDIAVVKLSDVLYLSPTIQQSLIIYQDAVFPENVPVVQAGWGRMSESGYDPSPVLLETQVYTINREYCQARYSELFEEDVPFITDNMICAGAPGGGRGACAQDEGGPLYYDNVLIGIISFNNECGNSTYPDVHTRVASYTNWIIETAVL
ncbi:trypsin, alkaline B-like [Ostrinia nubilalis]|uniref:trypsin, alkaline B-like n=1 Tax=Ostrinia nubilalis TaxID=29057 RepID=UPI00308269AA